MAEPGEILREHTGVLVDIAGRIPGGILGLTAARDTDVVELVAAAQAVVRSAQGVLAAAAGEVARRSESGGDGSLAKQHGFASARTMIAKQAAVSLGEASKLIDVGEAIRPRVALSGEALPADREHVAAAVFAGVLSVSIAQLIDETVTTIAPRLLGDDEADLEAALVAIAVSNGWSVGRFTAYCRQLPDQYDPEGAAPRDEHLKAKASIRMTRLSNGMLRIVAELDPERAAFFLAAMRARTNPRRSTGNEQRDEAAEGNDPSNDHAFRTADDAHASNEPEAPEAGDDQDATVTDIHARRGPNQPTRAETQLDAFTAILRDSLKADEGAQAGVDTTILVRMDLKDLLSGVGTATIDGIESPISAAAARRLAAEADLIPQVFDGDSVILDQGVAKRRFTKAQRYAILGMFVGCAFPHCDIPSSMTEIHHVGRWATRHQHGRATDLLNGIPLCGFHNRLMEQGWDIEFDEHRVPWFTPPAHVDFRRAPIRGGGIDGRRAA